jgi:hypothetical protein
MKQETSHVGFCPSCVPCSRRCIIYDTHRTPARICVGAKGAVSLRSPPPRTYELELYKSARLRETITRGQEVCRTGQDSKLSPRAPCVWHPQRCETLHRTKQCGGWPPHRVLCGLPSRPPTSAKHLDYLVCAYYRSRLLFACCPVGTSLGKVLSTVAVGARSARSARAPPARAASPLGGRRQDPTSAPGRPRADGNDPPSHTMPPEVGRRGLPPAPHRPRVLGTAQCRRP